MAERGRGTGGARAGRGADDEGPLPSPPVDPPDEAALSAFASSLVPSLGTKAYFRIGEVADLVGVEPHVLRYWEREFRSVRPGKSAKGQRVYSRRNVENLMRLRQLLYAEGFTIAGAKKKLQRSGLEPFEPVVESPAPSSPAPVHDSRLREELLTLRAEIADFLAELGDQKT